MTGILVVLIALLLPLIGKIRERAVNVVCTGRLHQLLLACRQYAQQATPNRDSFPTVVVDGEPTRPNLLPSRLLNDLRPYVGYPAIGRATGSAGLPPAVQCPRVEAFEGQRGPFDTIDPNVVTYYTGYAYLGGLGRAASQTGPAAARPASVPGRARPGPDVPGGALRGTWAGKPSLPSLPTPLPTSGLALRPGRAAAKQGDKGVLWADDVSLSSPTDGYWQFAHPRRGAAGGPKPLTYADSRGCLGQHRGYAEGRVEWVPAEHLGLGGGEVQAVGIFKTPPPYDASASYKAGSSYWWF